MTSGTGQVSHKHTQDFDISMYFYNESIMSFSEDHAYFLLEKLEGINIYEVILKTKFPSPLRETVEASHLYDFAIVILPVYNSLGFFLLFSDRVSHVRCVDGTVFLSSSL